MFNRSNRNLQKEKQICLKERRQQEERMKEEFSKLEELLNSLQIDQNTHERLKKVLEMGYKQTGETSLNHSYE